MERARLCYRSERGLARDPALSPINPTSSLCSRVRCIFHSPRKQDPEVFRPRQRAEGIIQTNRIERAELLPTTPMKMKIGISWIVYPIFYKQEMGFRSADPFAVSHHLLRQHCLSQSSSWSSPRTSPAHPTAPGPSGGCRNTSCSHPWAWDPLGSSQTRACLSPQAMCEGILVSPAPPRCS